MNPPLLKISRGGFLRFIHTTFISVEHYKEMLYKTLYKLVLETIHKQPFSIDQQVKIAMFDGRQSIIDID